MKKLILSTVGTSLLSNVADKNEKGKIYNSANSKSKDYENNILELLEKLEQKALDKLNSISTVGELRRLSAELNGIFGFYETSRKDKDDLHFLITTDTLQGKKCGDILKRVLTEKIINTDIFTPSELTTRTKYDFDQGIKNLLKWCDETLIGYKNAGYEIIFNLTGGFKSLQGYMNTIAMFYADKIIYIFESEKAELIEIPKLPIVIDKQVIKNNSGKFLLLSNNYNFRKEESSGIPETMIDEIEGEICLSVWGELIWNNAKQDILSEELIDLPFLKYTSEFIKLFAKAEKLDKIKLQETLGKTSKLLIESNGDISSLKKDGGLLYENYNNKNNNNLPIGHFRINQADRVSCSFNKMLTLRKFGRHDFINNNP